MSWEVFDRRRVPRGLHRGEGNAYPPAITYRPHHLTLSGALRDALGHPSAVEVLVDWDVPAIAVRPAEPDDPAAYTVSASGQVSAAALHAALVARGHDPRALIGAWPTSIIDGLHAARLVPATTP